jgi:hypothetical protein
MLLLIDENVPNSVAQLFASRGQDVRFARDLFPAGTPDPVIATIGAARLRDPLQRNRQALPLGQERRRDPPKYQALLSAHL